MFSLELSGWVIDIFVKAWFLDRYKFFDWSWAGEPYTLELTGTRDESIGVKLEAW